MSETRQRELGASGKVSVEGLPVDAVGDGAGHDAKHRLVLERVGGVIIPEAAHGGLCAFG